MCVLIHFFYFVHYPDHLKDSPSAASETELFLRESVQFLDGISESLQDYTVQETLSLPLCIGTTIAFLNAKDSAAVLDMRYILV